MTPSEGFRPPQVSLNDTFREWRGLHGLHVSFEEPLPDVPASYPGPSILILTDGELYANALLRD